MDDSLDFQNNKYVVQGVLQKNRFDDDLPLIQWASQRFHLYWFVKLDSAVEEEPQNPLELD